MAMPKSVTLVEVGPRDGLQNERRLVDTAIKLELIKQLSFTGLKKIEATSFVSPLWVPQMADAREVLLRIQRFSNISYPVLVPNLRGFESAIVAGAKEIAIFTAASETFCKKNINSTIAQSLKRFEPILERAKELDIKVRGYVSCVVGCPFEGEVSVDSVAKVSRSLYDLGCYEISLGDTIGIGDPRSISRMIEAVALNVPIDRLAGHYHNTYGRALANIRSSLKLGMAVFDSSVGGLGGCPYAPGSSGNVATENVVELMEELGIETGVDLERLRECSQWIKGYMESTCIQ